MTEMIDRLRTVIPEEWQLLAREDGTGCCIIGGGDGDSTESCDVELLERIGQKQLDDYWILAEIGYDVRVAPADLKAFIAEVRFARRQSVAT